MTKDSFRGSVLSIVGEHPITAVDVMAPPQAPVALHVWQDTGKGTLLLHHALPKRNVSQIRLVAKLEKDHKSFVLD